MPKVVVFDVIETLFSLEPLNANFQAAGFPGGSMRAWFSALLRDAFALEVTADFQPFKSLATANLRGLALFHQLKLSDDRLEEILGAVSDLPDYPDVKRAFELLRQAGLHIVALTNGSEKTTRAMFENSQLEKYIDRFISIDEIRHWKPSPRVYHYAAESSNRSPCELALVAAHAWDIHGAKRVGARRGL